MIAGNQCEPLFCYYGLFPLCNALGWWHVFDCIVIAFIQNLLWIAPKRPPYFTHALLCMKFEDNCKA